MILVREGWSINTKRTRRLRRAEGLWSPQRCPKPAGLLDRRATRRSSRPNEVWAIDFCFDETADYRRLKLTNIVDEFTREALATDVHRSSTADDLVGLIERLVAERGVPTYLRLDNGFGMVALALRDWCRLPSTATVYIEPGSPWENLYVDSLNGRARDELPNIEEFGTLAEARLEKGDGNAQKDRGTAATNRSSRVQFLLFDCQHEANFASRGPRVISAEKHFACATALASDDGLAQVDAGLADSLGELVVAD